MRVCWLTADSQIMRSWQRSSTASNCAIAGSLFCMFSLFSWSDSDYGDSAETENVGKKGRQRMHGEAGAKKTKGSSNEEKEQREKRTTVGAVDLRSGGGEITRTTRRNDGEQHILLFDYVQLALISGYPVSSLMLKKLKWQKEEESLRVTISDFKRKEN